MHQRTVQCKKGEERKQQRLAKEEERAFTSRAFSAYGCPLEMVTSFKYLGRVISAEDNSRTEVVRNLAKAWSVWQRLIRILIREGAAPQVSGFLFKSVVQSVLSFGAETWLVTPYIWSSPRKEKNSKPPTGGNRVPCKQNY